MKIPGSLTKLTAFAASLLIAPALLWATHQRTLIPAKKPISLKKAAASTPDSKKWTEAYGNLPLVFEQNVGQTGPQAQFLSHGDGYEIFLTPQETVLALHHTAVGTPKLRNGLRRGAPARKIEQESIVRLLLHGANPAAQPSGLNSLATRINYFIGNDSRNWHTDVPSFSRVQYQNVYPGIDLIYYGNHRRFEYDFIVNPGANPHSIDFDVNGAGPLHLDSDGNLIMNVDGAALDMQKPVIYQWIGGERREIAGNYVISGGRQVTFNIGPYDRSQPLVIDPVLNYSTYLGGSSLGDVAYGIAVDAAGDAYVTGQTNSITFPTSTSPYPSTANTNGSVFVSELNPTGTQLLYSTYLAGTGTSGEIGYGIALDPAPSANCLNSSSAASVCIYVTGSTSSTDFPTTSNGFSNGTISNPKGTAFLAKLNPTLTGSSALVYSSFIGGTNGDYGNSVAVDSSANAYIAGYTNSSPGAVSAGDFTLVGSGGAQSTLISPVGSAFLVRVDTTASGTNSLLYSTYLSGSGIGVSSGPGFSYGEIALGVAVDSTKTAYLVGSTTSPDFPHTSNAYLTAPISFTNGTNQSLFVSKIDTTITTPASLIYSTYLSGANPIGDFGWGIALGPNNLVYITGQTSSTSFPVGQAGTTGQYPSAAAATGVAFISVLDTTVAGSSALKYSELLGGTAGDSGQGIAVDSQGNAYVAGVSDSPNFPIVKGAFEPALLDTAEGDAFIAKISPNFTTPGTSDLLYSSYFGGTGNGVLPDRAYGIALDGAHNAYIAGQTSSTAATFPVFSTGGTAFQTTLTQTDTAATSAAFVAKLTLVPTVNVSPSTLTFSSQVVGVKSATQTVTLTNNTSSAIIITTAPAIAAGSPAVSGTDFATTANTCTGSIAAGAGCSVGVTFTASATGTETATLTFADSDGSSPQTVALSGTAVAAVFTVSVLPSSLTFPSQALNTASAAQTVTVTNTGNAPLVFGSSAIAITGSNAGDFSQTNTCNSATLAAPPATSGNACTISVTFTPTASTNPRTATLTITDVAAGSPQSVSLSGTASSVTPDFSLTAPTSPVTVTAGMPGSFTVDVVSIGGFTGAVTLTCTGTIPQGSCVAPASSVTPSAAPGTAASFSVTTTALLVAPPPSGRIPPVSRQQMVLFGLAALLLLVLPAMRQARTRLGLVGAMAMLMLIAGCGGGSSATRTPAGSYTLTVTGTSGSTTHTATVTVSVQ